MHNTFEPFNKYERQAYQAAIDLDQDLEDFAAAASELGYPGDRTLTNWIKSKHAAHAESLYDFNAILDAIDEY